MVISKTQTDVTICSRVFTKLDNLRDYLPVIFSLLDIFYLLGLFNVSDKILVSLEILVEWRHLFHCGVPLSTAIESKLWAMTERVEVSLNSIAYC